MVNERLRQQGYLYDSVEKSLCNEERFWNAFKNAQMVFYDWANDFIVVEENDEHYALHAHSFLNRLLKQPIPDAEFNPVIILNVLIFFKDQIEIIGWEKYTTLEYFEEITRRAAEPADIVFVHE